MVGGAANARTTVPGALAVDRSVHRTPAMSVSIVARRRPAVNGSHSPSGPTGRRDSHRCRALPAAGIRGHRGLRMPAMRRSSSARSSRSVASCRATAPPTRPPPPARPGSNGPPRRSSRSRGDRRSVCLRVGVGGLAGSVPLDREHCARRAADGGAGPNRTSGACAYRRGLRGTVPSTTGCAGRGIGRALITGRGIVRRPSGRSRIA